MSTAGDSRTRQAAPDDTLRALDETREDEPRIILAAPAGDRILGRRGFLRGGLLAGAAMQAAACGGGKKDDAEEGWSRTCLAQYYPSHAGAVTALAVSRDGTRIATAGDDHLVKVWNAATGALLQTYRGHATAVNAVALSPDGQRCASIGDVLHIWDAGTGELLVDHGTWKGYALAYSPDGRRVVAGMDYGSVYAFDAEAAGQILVFAGAFGRINSLAFSPDGTRLVAACASVCVWDASTRALLRTYSAQSPSADVPVRAAVFSPDGTRIASAGSNATVHVWDAASGVRQVAFTRHAGAVTSVAFDATGTRVVSCSAEATWLWDATATGSLETALDGLAPARLAAFSPDGSRLVLARLNQFWRQTGGQFRMVQDCRVVVALAPGPWRAVALLGDPSGPPIEQVDSAADCSAGRTIPGAACHCDVVCGCDMVCTCDAQGGCYTVFCLIVF